MGQKTLYPKEPAPWPHPSVTSVSTTTLPPGLRKNLDRKQSLTHALPPNLLTKCREEPCGFIISEVKSFSNGFIYITLFDPGNDNPVTDEK